MGSDLKNNVTSDWIKATGVFGHTPERTPVTLFVEGDDDVPLWEEAVKPYQIKYDIRVKTNKAINPDEGNGKTMLLTMPGLGPSLVVAVDADFDLVIDDYSPYTNQVRNSDYVVNTTWYSIENILLQKTSCIDMLIEFSEAFAETFYDYLYTIKQKEETQPNAKFGEILLSMNIQKLAVSGDFSSIISTDIPDDAERSAFVQSIADKGYSRSDLWKLMRGHNLWNTIVKPNEDAKFESEINARIQNEQVSKGLPVDRSVIMNSMGIFSRVREYTQRKFYYEDMGNINIPAPTRAKLDNLFS